MSRPELDALRWRRLRSGERRRSLLSEHPEVAAQFVAAIGRPAFVTADFIREGAVVVDVGINRLDDAAEVARCYPGDEAKAAAFAAKGSLLVGDVHPVDVRLRASRFTPVPGGVGPLTIARLLANTVDLCRARRGL